MNTNEEIMVNPSPVKDAGSCIKKSVLYRVIAQICSIVSILFAVLFLFQELIPATIENRLNNVFYGKLIISFVFMVAFSVFWILSLTTLNKAGLLLMECDNMSMYGSRSKTERRKKIEVDWIPFLTILAYILIALYPIIQNTVRIGLSIDFLTSLRSIAIILAIIGGYLVVKKSKWTFLTGIVIILIQLYFLYPKVMRLVSESYFHFRFFFRDFIIIILLLVFIFKTVEYYKDSKSDKQLNNSNL